jgi:hypothetical protein
LANLFNQFQTILARVDGTTYSLFGGASGVELATTKGVSYTSSHTLVDLTAGPASITLDFFSPVFPGTNDYVRQSLPYSYLTVTANSSSSAVDVQVLSAIDYTWTAQTGAAELNYTRAGSAAFWWWYNSDEIWFTEKNDMATYGSVLFGTTTGSSVTYGADTASNVYGDFNADGKLTSPSSVSSTDLAALAKDLGTINEGSSGNVTFVVGHNRDQAINYLGTHQTGVYRADYWDVQDAVPAVLADYSSVYQASISFDNEVRSKAEAVSSTFGSQYADIIEASVRQTFGALELTVPLHNLNATPQAFLKEISSDGNVNTVDVIFQTWPIFISLNPAYIRYLFQPIISYLESGAWPHNYVIHDLGYNYPNATGHNDGNAEQMPLFETSSLFILFYAYQKYTGDTSWAKQYLALLEEYANYLVANATYPISQLSSADAITAYANQTGLAIQSAIGLKAAAEVTGNTSYATAATSLANRLYNGALGLNAATVAKSTHFTYWYGQDSTWQVLFPAFSDVLLNLSTFPSAAWSMQSTWYESQFQTAGLPYVGPSNDLKYTGSNITFGLADWNVVAAAASSSTVQEKVINSTHAFLANGLNDIPYGKVPTMIAPRLS